MFRRDFVAGSGLDIFILPVGVIELQLNELRVRVSCQQLIEEVRCIMERKSPVLYDPLLLESANVIPETVFIVFVNIILSECMQQIKIKVACPGALETDPQLIFGRLLILCGELRRVELRSKIIRISRVPLDEGLAGGLLRSFIYKCGIHVFAARIYEGVDHFLRLLYINNFLFPIRYPGETHHTKAEFNTVVNQFFHNSSSLSDLPGEQRGIFHLCISIPLNPQVCILQLKNGHPAGWPSLIKRGRSSVSRRITKKKKLFVCLCVCSRGSCSSS